MTHALRTTCAFCLFLACTTRSAPAQAGVPWPGKNAEETFDLRAEQTAKSYTAQETACSAAANVLWPGEDASFTLQLANLTDQPLAAKGKAEVIQYSMTSPLDDVWTQTFHRVAVHEAVPLQVNIPAKGFVDVAVSPKVPATLGALSARLGELTLDTPEQRLSFAPHETRTVALKVTGGQPSEANTYPLSVSFDAGKDGRAVLSEDLHVNVIARRTVAVDGKLDDWQGALPHTVRSGGDLGPNLTEKAWLPFVSFPEKTGTGVAVAYLAYDGQALYFAAKVADDSPDGGGVRFATRDDDQYYYPEKATLVHADGRREELTWPKDVRRFSYRKNPDLPFGGDAVQIAFNVLPQDKKGLYPFPPGTMERFMVYKDTDYEYYLHPVAQAYGGGTEIWRLLAPGVPRKHFYPRQPKAETDGGPVPDGKLAVTQDGRTRILECALPWTEIPDVKAALDAGRTIKFSFRVTDDKGPTYELAADRSVSKMNNLAFHEYWMTHWANEVEFAFEPPAGRPGQ